MVSTEANPISSPWSQTLYEVDHFHCGKEALARGKIQAPHIEQFNNRAEFQVGRAGLAPDKPVPSAQSRGRLPKKGVFSPPLRLISPTCLGFPFPRATCGMRLSASS